MVHTGVLIGSIAAAAVLTALVAWLPARRRGIVPADMGPVVAQVEQAMDGPEGEVTGRVDTQVRSVPEIEQTA